MKKNKLISILLSGLLLSGLVACKNNNSNNDNSSNNIANSEVSSSLPTNSASIRIASTVNKVSIGHSITIRVLVTGTAKRDVTWTSSDTSVATIESNGKLTGLSAGKTIVTAALVEDPNVKATVEVTVVEAQSPDSIAINGEETMNGWVGESVKLEVTLTPENADPRLIYTSSNEQIALVDEEGTISFLEVGVVNITVSSFTNESVNDVVTFNVKKGAFLTNKGGYADNMDYSHQGEEDNPYIQTKYEIFDGDNTPAFAWFNTEASTRYYAKANFNITKSTSDPWTRVGIGSATNDVDSRVFYFSDKEGQKTVMLNYPNEWGASAARTMIWQVNGIKKLDPTNITIGVLRDENKYYYTINDQLYWYEELNRFDEMPTLPVIVTKDVEAIISNPVVINDDAMLDTLVNSAEFGKVFFNSGSSDGQVTFSNDKDFKFNNIYTDTDNSRFRDQCVKSYGDKGLIAGNFTIEFDLEEYQNFEDDINSMLGVALRRYEADGTIPCDSFMIDANNFHFRSWNYDSQFANGTIGTSYNTKPFSSNVSEMEKVHVKIVREVSNIYSTFKIYLNDQEYKFVDSNNEETELIVNYTGKYLIMVGANNAIGRVKNFTFAEANDK